MNEIWIGTRTIIGVAGILAFAYLKMLGGRTSAFGVKGRIWKRWIAPIFLGVWLCLFALLVGSFHWVYLLSILGYIIESYLDGWGNDSESVLLKVLSRLVSAVLFSLVSLVFVLVSGKWVWWGIQAIIGSIITILAQFQGTEKAPSEEVFIHFGRAWLTPFML